MELLTAGRYVISEIKNTFEGQGTNTLPLKVYALKWLHQSLSQYDNEETVRKMVSEQKNMKISTELISKCPVCGAPPLRNNPFASIQTLSVCWLFCRRRKTMRKQSSIPHSPKIYLGSAEAIIKHSKFTTKLLKND